MYKVIPLQDSGDSRIRPFIQEANEYCLCRFIDSAIGSGGKVLVHCMYGISRSASMVLAYLMHKLQIPLKPALRQLKTAHRETDPNEDFLLELKTYERELFTPMEVFACRMCRAELFKSTDFETHTSAAAKRFEKRAPQREPQLACSSYFLTPAPWMGEMNEQNGKLYCPKCQCKLGEYTWSGSQCSCGRFVTPGFRIPKSNVDLLQPPSHLHIAQPRLPRA